MTDPIHDPAPPFPAGDPSLAAVVRAALAGTDPGTTAYLDLGARLDRVAAARTGDGAVAWLSLHATRDRPWIIALGAEPAEVARCVTGLVERVGTPEGLTVARGCFPLLPDGLRPIEHWEWDWWYATAAPEPRPGEQRVVRVPPDDPRITTLLDAASPDAMARPGDRRILGWWGIQAAAAPHAGLLEPDPRDLVAVAAVTTMRPPIPHISSVATAVGWRGHGLARDLCARITRDQLATGAPAVTLGMHAGNLAARRVYSALGYRVGCRWASGLAPRPRPSASREE